MMVTGNFKRMDFVKKGGTVYLVTASGLWDFRAWLKGYYDAYIPLSEIKKGGFKVIGNFKNNPELLPPECEGYNGEPHVVKVADIWANPKFKHEGNLIIACAGNCGKTTEDISPYEFWRGKVEQVGGNLVPKWTCKDCAVKV